MLVSTPADASAPALVTAPNGCAVPVPIANAVPSRRPRVTKLETGRRASVSVAELLALAAVLNCPPVMLMTADERSQPGYRPGYVNPNYQVTPTMTEDMGKVRAWIRGAGPLGEHDDSREYYAELPVGESFTPGHMTSDGEAWVGPVQQRFLPREDAGGQDG